MILITVLISVLLPANHCNGLMSPRSHRPTGKARPTVLISCFSAHLDVHLLAHILSVPEEKGPGPEQGGGTQLDGPSTFQDSWRFNDAEPGVRPFA